MRDLLPVICPGQAQRTDGPGSPAVLDLGVYGPARPAFGRWPPPEGQPACSLIRAAINMQGVTTVATGGTPLPRPSPRRGEGEWARAWHGAFHLIRKGAMSG